MVKPPAGALAGADGIAVVAGNGPSLASADLRRFSEGSAIVRVNNFFFERGYHLGRRVDLAVISGDPRILPFYFATLKQVEASGAYDIRRWTSQRPLVQEKYGRILVAPFTPFRFRDDTIASNVRRLSREAGAEPTTGVYAVLAAHGQGARRIVLAGLDLYQAEHRYPFEPGRNVVSVLGKDYGKKSYDTRLHSRDLDLAILSSLHMRDDCEIMLASEDSPLRAYFDLAPLCRETAHVEPKVIQIDDWIGRAGIYPLWLLRFLRNGRRFQQRITATLTGKHPPP